MNEEERKIIISKISEYHQKEPEEYRHRSGSIMHRWFTYAMLIPIVIVLVLIGIFFFAAFLALLAVAIMVIGIRFWWLRRKFEGSLQQPDNLNRQTGADQTIIVEDAQIIEETEIRSSKHKK